MGFVDAVRLSLGVLMFVFVMADEPAVSFSDVLLRRFDLERPKNAHFFDFVLVSPLGLLGSLFPEDVTVVMVRGILLSGSGPYGCEGLPKATPIA